jgi:hypothetical protein
MTDEEMAEKYESSKHYRYEDNDYCGDIADGIKQAFLAGLKAGKEMADADLATVAYMQGAERYKTKWHKVADGDYPPIEVGNFTVDVLTDRGEIAYYAYDNECWVVEPSSAEIDTPIAWCEIPTFTEEKE